MNEDQEIRAKALELALKAPGGRSYVRTADEFEQYLKNGKQPDPEPKIEARGSLFWFLEDQVIGDVCVYDTGRVALILSGRDRETLINQIKNRGSIMGLDLSWRRNPESNEPA